MNDLLQYETFGAGYAGRDAKLSFRFPAEHGKDKTKEEK
jgi:hypothetical protein